MVGEQVLAETVETLVKVEITVVGTVMVETKPVGQVVDTVVGTVMVETRPVGQVVETVLVDVTVLTPVPEIVVVAPGKLTVLGVQDPVTVVEIREQVPLEDDPYPQPPPQPPPT